MTSDQTSVSQQGTQQIVSQASHIQQQQKQPPPSSPQQQQTHQNKQPQQVIQTRCTQNPRQMTEEEIEDERVRKNTMMNVKMSVKRKKIEEINQMHRSDSSDNILAKSLMNVSNLLQNQLSMQQQQASHMNFMSVPNLMQQFPTPTFPSPFGVGPMDPQLLHLQLLLGSQQTPGAPPVAGISGMNLPIAQKSPDMTVPEQPTRKKSLLKSSCLEEEDNHEESERRERKSKTGKQKKVTKVMEEGSGDEDSEPKQNSEKEST